MALPEMPLDDEAYELLALHGEHIPPMPRLRQEYVETMIEVARENGSEPMFTGSTDYETKTTRRLTLDEILHPPEHVKKIVIRGATLIVGTGAFAVAAYGASRYVRRDKK